MNPCKFLLAKIEKWCERITHLKKKFSENMRLKYKYIGQDQNNGEK